MRLYFWDCWKVFTLLRCTCEIVGGCSHLSNLCMYRSVPTIWCTFTYKVHTHMSLQTYGLGFPTHHGCYHRMDKLTSQFPHLYSQWFLIWDTFWQISAHFRVFCKIIFCHHLWLNTVSGETQFSGLYIALNSLHHLYTVSVWICIIHTRFINTLTFTYFLLVEHYSRIKQNWCTKLCFSHQKEDVRCSHLLRIKWWQFTKYRAHACGSKTRC